MRLYLPDEWTQDRARMKSAGVPDTVGFETKWEIALKQIDDAIAVKQALAFLFGCGQLIGTWRACGIGHVHLTVDKRLKSLTGGTLANVEANRWVGSHEGIPPKPSPTETRSSSH